MKIVQNVRCGFAAACVAFLIASPAVAGVTPSKYAKCVEIELSSEAKFALGGATLADFPLLVRLSGEIDGFEYAHFGLENGGDLRFALEDGTLLPSEIDTWNETGTSLAWVTVPSLAASTKIIAYYGSEDPDEMTPSAAWSAYAGVWHLNEATAGATTVADASGNSDGTSHAKSLVTGGVFGRARGRTDATGQNGATMTAPKTDALDALVPTFTVSGWFCPTTLQANWCYVFSRKNADNYKSWGWQFRGSDNMNSVGIYSSGTADSDSNRTLFSTSGKFAANVWTKYDVVYTSTQVSLYLNGALLSTKTIVPAGGAVNGTLDFTVGGLNGSGHGTVKGYFDETRLRAGVLDSAWIAADYAQATNAAFLAFAAAENTDPTAVKFDGRATVEKTGESFRVSATTTSESGTGALTVKYGTLDAYDLSVAVSASAESSTTYSATLTGLVADTSYRVRMEGVNAKGTVSKANGDKTLYNGTVSIAAGADADEVNLTTPGTFTVSRADTYGDLVVNYSVGGTAVAGTNYRELPGSVTIPDGAASATIEVYPLRTKDADHTLTVTLADGLYFVPSGAAASASIAVKMLAAPAGWNTWIAPADGKASVAENWSDGVPSAGDRILFDGRYSVANCEWDGGVNGLTDSLSAWSQTADYAGTVTIDTTYESVDTTFTCLAVTGDVDIRGGSWTHPGPQKTATYRLRASVGGSFNLAAGTSVNCRYKGFEKGTCHAGGAVGVHGGSTADYAKTRDSVYFPCEIGNGGHANGKAETSCGGGAVWLEVAGAMTMNGDIDVHGVENTGSWNYMYGGAPGAVYIRAKSLDGAGKIRADAPYVDRAGSNSPTGGRIAIYLTEATSLGVPVANMPHYGAIQYSAGAGTLFVKTAGQTHGTLYVSNTKKSVIWTCGLTYHQLTGVTPVAPGETWTFDSVVLENEGCLAIPEGTTLALPNGFKSVRGNGLFCGILYQGGTITCGDGDAVHTIASNWVFHAQRPFTFDRGVVVKDGAAIGQMRFVSTKAKPSVCEVTVNGDLTVEGTGYLWARGTSLVNNGNFESDFNGRVAGTYCHGGLVGIYAAKLPKANYTNETAVYGSIFNPAFPGTHGAGNDGNDQHMGGGFLRLTVNGALTLDGHAYADGGAYGYEKSGTKGSGGALCITAKTLSGTGTIDADGTANGCTSEENLLAKFFPVNSNSTRNIATCSGGGRVAVKLTEGAFSDYWVTNVTAKGASRKNDGKTAPSLYAMSSAGTVFLGNDRNVGTVYVRNDGHSDNTLAVTPIPAAANSYAATDDVGDFKKANLYIGGCGRVLLAETLKMCNLTMEPDTALDLNGQTLTVYKAALGATRLATGTYAASDAAVAGYVSDSGTGGKLVVAGVGIVMSVR